MDQISIALGSKTDIPLQLRNRGAITTPTFSGSDTFTAVVSRGNGEATLFAPAVAWDTFGGQTGYDQGQVVVSISAVQAATLEAAGLYQLEVWWTQQTSMVARVQLRVTPAAGSAVQAVTPYCTYQDLLLYAPWISNIQAPDSDVEGFYAQRLQARQWLDDLILRAWQSGGVAQFGDPGWPAASWSNGWSRATPMTDPTMRQWLADDLVFVRPQVARVCAYKAIALVCLAQVGRGSYAGFGAMYEDKASEELCGLVIEVDTNGDGIADIPIPLGTSNTLYG